MPAKLAHIAISAEDVERAIRFYAGVLGWKFTPWGPPNFYHIKGAGVHGALQQRASDAPDGQKGIECTFAVSDLNETMAAVTDAGGQVLGEPFTIENVGTLVKIQDTERNALILMQYEPVYAAEIGIDPAGLK